MIVMDCPNEGRNHWRYFASQRVSATLPLSGPLTPQNSTPIEDQKSNGFCGFSTPKYWRTASAKSSSSSLFAGGCCQTAISGGSFPPALPAAIWQAGSIRSSALVCCESLSCVGSSSWL